VVEFKNDSELRKWFEGQPREFSVVMASRAALRVVPRVSDLFDVEGLEVTLSSVLLATFRALASSSAASKYPTAGKELSAVNAAANTARTSYTAINTANTARAAYSAVEAVEAAAFTAYAAGAVEAVEAAVRTAYAAGATFAASSLESYLVPGSALFVVFAADANLLEAGMAPERLARSPLWPNEKTGGLNVQWQDLKKNLLALNQDWQVWTGWYEDILAGRNRASLPDDLAKDLDLKIAKQDNDWWQRGAAAVNKDIADWTEEAHHLAVLQRAGTPKGAFVFERRGGQFRIAGEEKSDLAVAQKKEVRQDLEEISYKADLLVKTAKGLGNQYGWEDFEPAAQRFAQSVSGNPEEVAANITRVWARLVSLGSFLEYNERLSDRGRKSNATTLDEDVRRALADLVRTAAPLVREFPSARQKDDESGAFLTKIGNLLPVKEVFEAAGDGNVLRQEDVELLRELLDAFKHGDFQGQKAGAIAHASARSLLPKVLKFVATASFGAVISAADLPEVNAAADMLIGVREQVVEIFKDSPDDIRFAVIELMKDVESQHKNIPSGHLASPMDVRKQDDQD